MGMSSADSQDQLHELGDLARKLAKLEPQRTELRARASVLVVALLRAGLPPTEVAAISPFSTAHVRTLARIAGLPPARRNTAKGA